MNEDRDEEDLSDSVFAGRICTLLIRWPNDHFDLVSLSQIPWFNWESWSDGMWRRGSQTPPPPSPIAPLFCKAVIQPSHAPFNLGQTALFKTSKPSLNLWGASRTKLRGFLSQTLQLFWSQQERIWESDTVVRNSFSKEVFWNFLDYWFYISSSFSLSSIFPGEKVYYTRNESLAPFSNSYHLQEIFLGLLLSLKCPNPL